MTCSSPRRRSTSFNSCAKNCGYEKPRLHRQDMAAPGKPQSVESGWNSPQRRALLLLISLLLLVLIVQLILNRRYVPQHPAQGGRAAELASRLDPNTADWQALAAIPNLGEKRAREIVSFRERVRG